LNGLLNDKQQRLNRRKHMKTKQKSWSGWLRAGLSGLAATCVAGLGSVANSAAPLVFTEDGPVVGVQTSTDRQFLGIPYAAAPVGDLRWRPPVRHARWFAPLQATQFANHCPQPATPFGVASVTEDCLFLNVFTPDRDRDRDQRDHGRAVMVWIHGGAFTLGESDDYDPTNLVAQGVLVVTINYRLGALGFLAHPAFAAEATDPDRDDDPDHAAGNYGLMDQQAALKWVRQNIAAFGGDPDNVTIFGESAGGLSVLSQLASPAAKGLFHKAIVESGAYRLTLPTLAVAEAQGTAYATSEGCTDQTAACLRALTVAEVLARESVAAGYVPNLDGEFLPLSPGTAFATGKFNRVPVIQGSNHDEWRLFTALDFDLVGSPITAPGYQAALATLVGPAAGLVAAQYPLTNFASPDIAFAAAGTDLIFACPALAADQSLSQFVPVFAYEFNDENAPEDFLPPVTFPYGSAHASEIQYLFNLGVTVPRPALNANQEALSDTMVRYWTEFAEDSDPNAHHLPLWQKFGPQPTAFQSLDTPSPHAESGFATDHHCAFWTALLSGP
jgi:para-nitrobenzyl esterase